MRHSIANNVFSDIHTIKTLNTIRIKRDPYKGNTSGLAAFTSKPLQHYKRARSNTVHLYFRSSGQHYKRARSD